MSISSGNESQPSTKWMRDRTHPGWQYYNVHTRTLSIGPTTVHSHALREATMQSAQSATQESSEECQRSARCLITELPTELLLQILQYLIPANQTYHIVPTVHRGKPHMIVQTVCRYNERPDTMSTIARTCRRMHEEASDVFFASNRFILNITTSPMESRVGCAINTNISPRSWSSVQFYNNRTPLWPLTKRTVKLVKDLTLIVAYSSSSSLATVRKLQQKIMDTVSFIGPVDQASLERVSVHLVAGTAYLTYGRGFKINCMEVTLCDDGEVALTPRDIVCTRPHPIEIVEALKPFRAFIGLQHFRLIGIGFSELTGTTDPDSDPPRSQKEPCSLGGELRRKRPTLADAERLKRRKRAHSTKTPAKKKWWGHYDFKLMEAR